VAVGLPGEEFFIADDPAAHRDGTGGADVIGLRAGPGAAITRPAGCVVLLLLTRGAAPPPARAQDGCYTRLPSERISLDLREAPVQTLLRLLSKQYRVNMVVTDDVTGTVTVSFNASRSPRGSIG
jgi:hypothetical protein